HLRLVTLAQCRGARPSGSAARIPWLDSCVQSGFSTSRILGPSECALVVVDTTCFGATSEKIRRVVEKAAAKSVPIALVRSHTKLDCLGIEYGRLGSIVVATAGEGLPRERIAWAKRLAAEVRDSVRLFGLAPIPVHFPPFAGGPEYRHCMVARVGSIIRNTR